MSNQFPKKPKGVEIQHFSNYITIKYNWLNTDSLVYLILCLIGYIPVFLFFIVMINEGGSTAITAILFLTPLILIGGYFLYTRVINVINQTFITINEKAIIVRNQPIPTKSFDLRIVKIENIFSQVIQIIGKNNDPNHPDREETSYYYQVYAQTSNHTNKKIIETNNRAQMLFIERTLKDYLNIDDESQKVNYIVKRK